MRQLEGKRWPLRGAAGRVEFRGAHHGTGAVTQTSVEQSKQIGLEDLVHAVVPAVERAGLFAPRGDFPRVPPRESGSGGSELVPGLGDEREQPEPGIHQRGLGVAQLAGCPELTPRRAPPPTSKLEMRQHEMPLRPHIAGTFGLGQKPGDTLGARNILCKDRDRPHGEGDDFIRRTAELGYHRVGTGGVVCCVSLQRSKLEGPVACRAQLKEASREGVELAPVPVARRDSDEVVERTEIARVEEECSRKRLSCAGHREAMEGAPMKAELAQLVPRLPVIWIDLDDRAELLLCVCRPRPPHGQHRLEEAPVVDREPAAVAERELGGATRLVGPSEAFLGHPQAVKGEGEPGVGRGGFLKGADRRGVLTSSIVLLSGQVSLERRKGGGRYRGRSREARPTFSGSVRREARRQQIDHGEDIARIPVHRRLGEGTVSMSAVEQ
jgi:hypothetical protein